MANIKTLSSKKEIIFLKKNGRNYYGKIFKFIYLENSLMHNRYLFIIPKYLGNAVKRNLIRRRLRHILMLNKRDNDNKNFDIIIKVNRHCDYAFLKMQCLILYFFTICL